jgi:ADP-ribosyl-[dinitrogen reductase] hydrolase
VDWLPGLGLGRVGLTFAPGKRDAHAFSGAWHRDLGGDLQRLRVDYATRRLVCLLEDHELAELGIANLIDLAEAFRIRVRRLPIRDVEITYVVPS